MKQQLTLCTLLAAVLAAGTLSAQLPYQKIKLNTFNQAQRLNNLVHTIAFASETRGGRLTAEFAVENEQWVFLQFSSPVKNFQLLRNGSNAVDRRVLVKDQEFMLELLPGRYKVTAGSTADTLTIKHLNRIPEIYYYAPANVGGMEILDGSNHWEQIGGQLLSSTNLLAPAALTLEQQQIYRKAGRKIFFNTVSRLVSDHKAEVFAANVQKKLDMEIFDGFTVDEFDFRDPDGNMGYRDYGKALELVKNPQNKRMYT